MSLSSMRSGAGWEMSAMAEIRFDGLDTFVLSMRQVAELPDDVHDAMLNADRKSTRLNSSHRT